MTDSGSIGVTPVTGVTPATDVTPGTGVAPAMPVTQVTWVDGMQFVAQSAGHAMILDGGPGFGRDTGMSPLNLLLLGVAGCSAMDVVHFLKNRMRRQVTGLRVEVSSEQAAEHPKVYTRIDLRYLVRGRGLKEKDVRRAIQLSESKFCAAAVMLGKTAEITTSFEIAED